MTKFITTALILCIGVLTACSPGGTADSAKSNAPVNQASGSGNANTANADNSATAAESGGTEKRCGWYSNPTPANHYLSDRDGQWVIGEQGGYQADDKSFDNIPDFGGEWVKTNTGSYGYGCACFDVTVDKKAKKILSIKKGEKLPLEKCRADKSLTEPGKEASASPKKAGPVELVVNGVKRGSEYSTIVKQLGKPDEIAKQGQNQCTDADEKTLGYEGLVITVDKTATERDYSLLDMTVTSSKWVTDKGVKIGDSPEQVMAKYGQTKYEDSDENPGEKSLGYDMKRGPGGVYFYFENDKLVRIELRPTIC